MKALWCVALANGAIACASSPPPSAEPASQPVATERTPAAPAPSQSSAGAEPPATAAVASVAVPAPAPAASAPPKDEGNGCHVEDELERAFEKFGGSERKKQWMADAHAHLLSSEDAERALPGITQEIVSAIAHRRYDKLAAFAGKDGICMRAARGASCQMLSPRALAGCGATRVRTPWEVAGTNEQPQYSCGEAFRRIFYARDFLHVGKPRFNCFPEPGRGNNKAPVMSSGPHLGYVELYSEQDGAYRSLWLVFGGEPRAPELLELISDYPVP